MICKAILLDLDNTLYSYDLPHKKALKRVEEFCIEKFNIKSQTFQYNFKIARNRTHINLENTGASHNRILYFQGLLELINEQSLEHSLTLYNLYWDTFLDIMILNENVEEILKEWKNKGIKLCLLTDLTAHIQFRKIKKLGLQNYIDFMVTSEEVGHEKPHPVMFYTALNKTETSKDKVFMVGDNWNKDILGALNFGIKPIWLNESNSVKEPPLSKEVFTIKKFKDIEKIIR